MTNITQEAHKKFNLLPTSQPHVWLIVADWIEETGSEYDIVIANAFREGIWNININGTFDVGENIGFGYGDGQGSFTKKKGYGSGFRSTGSGGVFGNGKAFVDCNYWNTQKGGDGSGHSDRNGGGNGRGNYDEKIY